MNEYTKKKLEDFLENISKYNEITRPTIPDSQLDNIKGFEKFLLEFSEIVKNAIYLNSNEELTSLIFNLIPTIEGLISDLSNLYRGIGKSSQEVYTKVFSFMTIVYSPTGSPVIGHTPYLQFAPYFLAVNRSADSSYAKLEDVTKDLLKKKEELDDLITSLKNEASKISISNYASIFGKQAHLHSYFSVSKLRIGLGSSERWLIVSLLSIISLIIVFFHANFGNQIFDLIFFDDYSVITFIAQKIALISLLLLILRFSLNNYKINKNLYIANIHRQNILNSMKLLFDSLPSDNNDSKSKLMELVSSSIFGLGKNPYEVNNKNDKIDLNSISEIIKLTKI